MKKVLCVFILAVVFIVAQSIGYATTFTFGDNAIIWPTWGNGSDDGNDSVGDPHIGGGANINAGQLTIDNNGYLTEIRFSYSSYNSNITAGDVFIDTDADADWDYVINKSTGVWQVLTDKYVVDKSKYSSSDGGKTFSNATGYGYLTSTYYFPSTGYGSYRELHPATAYQLGNNNLFTNKDSSIGFSDFNSSLTDVVFSDLDGLYVGNLPIIIGFGPTCTNDTVYQKVPEPMTVLLLGLGLLGLGLGARKRTN